MGDGGPRQGFAESLARGRCPAAVVAMPGALRGVLMGWLSNRTAVRASLRLGEELTAA